MHTAIVNSEDSINRAVEEAKSRGLRLACSSNAGLPTGFLRLTFLPESAFVERNDQKLGVLREPKI